MTTTEYLSENDTRKIFPPGELGYYIDFARLRPKISDEIPGEKLHLTCEFGIGTAKDDKGKVSTFSNEELLKYGFKRSYLNKIFDAIKKRKISLNPLSTESISTILELN